MKKANHRLETVKRAQAALKDRPTVSKRKARAMELLMKGAKTREILALTKNEFGGMAIGAGTLTRLRKQLAKKQKLHARRAIRLARAQAKHKQLQMPLGIEVPPRVTRAAAPKRGIEGVSSYTMELPAAMVREIAEAHIATLDDRALLELVLAARRWR